MGLREIALNAIFARGGGMTATIKPMIVWVDSNGLNTLKPSVETTGWRRPLGNEKRVHVAADGTPLVFNVGERDFIELSFPWQTAALKTQWETWWEHARLGGVFYLYEDDSYETFDGGVNYDATINYDEVISGGATHAEHKCICDMQELDISQMDVYGYWNVFLRLRRIRKLTTNP